MVALKVLVFVYYESLIWGPFLLRGHTWVRHKTWIVEETRGVILANL